MKTTPEDKRRFLIDFYEVVKVNPEVRNLVSWEGFAKHCEEVGLYYHPEIGLMTREAWEAIKPFINIPRTP